MMIKPEVTTLKARLAKTSILPSVVMSNPLPVPVLSQRPAPRTTSSAICSRPDPRERCPFPPKQAGRNYAERDSLCQPQFRAALIPCPHSAIPQAAHSESSAVSAVAPPPPFDYRATVPDILVHLEHFESPAFPAPVVPE